MKYLVFIFTIVLLASGLTLFNLLPEEKIPKSDVALTINGRDIAQETVNSQSTGSGYHDESRSQLYNTIITRELLIEEAKKLEIDKEESFRKALKNYYENSLIKILMERKNSQIRVSVTEQQIDSYISYLGKTVTFTRLDTIPAPGDAVQNIGGLTTRVLFDDLAEPVKLLLASLTPGDFIIKFDTGSDKYAIRLDNVEPTESTMAAKPDRAHIGRLLEEFAREQQLNQWMADLNKAATITIHDNEKTK